MRSTSIFFRPHGTPTVEHVSTAAGDAVLLEAGGMAFTFRDQADLDGWVDQVCVARDAARVENERRLAEACRDAIASPLPGVVGDGIELAHRGRS
jgi:hypothetical protein